MPRKTASKAAPAKKTKGGAQPRSRDANGLTPKQAMFVAEYLLDLNATQAAARAGYSAKTANEQGAQLLANVSVRSAIDAAMAKRANKLEITTERVLAEIARLAFFDARNLFDEGGNPIRVPDLDEDSARAIVGMDVVMIGNADMGIGQVQKVKLADKKGALELLGRHMGLFKDTLKISGSMETVTKVIKVPLKQYAAEQEAAARAAGKDTATPMTAGAISVPLKGKWAQK